MASFGHRMAGGSLRRRRPARTWPRPLLEASARPPRAVTLQLGDGTERSVSWPRRRGNGRSRPFAVAGGHGDELIGEIAIVKQPNEPLRPAERALLEDLAGNAGLALHNVRLAVRPRDQGRRSSPTRPPSSSVPRDGWSRRGTPNAAAWNASCATASGPSSRDIRDEIDVDAQRVETEHVVVEESLDELGARANAALEELRDVARGIFPSMLSDQGLGAALDALVRKTEPRSRSSWIRRPTDGTSLRWRTRSTSAASRRCRTPSGTRRARRSRSISDPTTRRSGS